MNTIYFQFTLSSFAQINCSPLTKEIVFPETIKASSFWHTKLIQVAVKNILIQSNETINLLADLLLKNSQPEVTDVLDVLNAGLGSKLLVVAENSIQIDADEYENVLSNRANHVSRMLYPENHLQQIMVYKMLQKEITRISPQFRVAFFSAKIPVEELDSLLLEQPDVRTRRDVDIDILQKDLLSDVLNTIQGTICNLIVSKFRTGINSTINNWIEELKSLDVSTDENIVFTLLDEALEVMVLCIEQSWNYINQWLDNNNSSDFLCDSLLNTTNSSAISLERKRRDVEPTNSNNILSNRVFLLLLAPLYSITFRWGIVCFLPGLFSSFNLAIRFR